MVHAIRGSNGPQIEKCGGMEAVSVVTKRHVFLTRLAVAVSVARDQLRAAADDETSESAKGLSI